MSSRTGAGSSRHRAAGRPRRARRGRAGPRGRRFPRCAPPPGRRRCPGSRPASPRGPTAWPTRSMQTIMSIESSGTSGWSTKYCEPIIEDRKFGGSSASKAAKITPRVGCVALQVAGHLDQDRHRRGVVVGAAVDRAPAPVADVIVVRGHDHPAVALPRVAAPARSRRRPRESPAARSRSPRRRRPSPPARGPAALPASPPPGPRSDRSTAPRRDPSLPTILPSAQLCPQHLVGLSIGPTSPPVGRILILHFRKERPFMKTSSRHFFGIDLGTSSCSIAYVADDPRQRTAQIVTVQTVDVAVRGRTARTSSRTAFPPSSPRRSIPRPAAAPSSASTSSPPSARRRRRPACCAAAATTSRP